MSVVIIIAIVVAVAVIARFQSDATKKTIAALEHRLTDLESKLGELAAGGEPAPQPRKAEEPGVATNTVQAPETERVPDVAALPEAINDRAQSQRDETDVRPPVRKAAPNHKAPPFANMDWERTLGVRLPVWIGAAVLAIAGFFLVKFAMDSGVFTPWLRVTMAALSATALLAAAVFVLLAKPANGDRIATALAAASIATFYGTAFLACSVFALVSPTYGFAADAIAASLAMVIAFYFGQPLLFVGLAGGYGAPLFLGTGAHSPGTAAYLIAIYVASFAIVGFRDWWKMAIVTVLGIYLYLLPGLLLNAVADQNQLSALLIAVAAAPAAAAMLPGFMNGEVPAPALRSVLYILGAVGLSFWLAMATSGAAPAYTLGFVGFAAIAIGFDAIVSPRVPAQLIAGAAALLVISGWHDPDPMQYLRFILPVSLLFTGGAMRGLLRQDRPLLWSGILCLTAAAAFIASMIDLNGWGGGRDLPHLWAALAIVLASAMVAGAIILPGRGKDPERVRAAFAASASGFLSIAIALEVSPNFYALSAALQVLGLSIFCLRYRMVALGWLAGIYTALLVALLGLGYLHPGQFLYGSVLPREIYQLPSFADQPWPLLLAPAALLLASATLLLRFNPVWVARVQDALAIGLVALGLYYVIPPNWEDSVETRMFTTGGLWLLAELAISVVAILIGRRIARPSLVYPAAVLLTLGGLSSLGLEAVPVYRFWPDTAIFGPALLNSALIALGGAAALLAIGANDLKRDTSSRAQWSAKMLLEPIAGFLLFTLLLVEIRHAFHGASLQGGIDQLELYTYSVGMLIFGFVVLGIGIVLKSQAARALSLAFVLATVGKVFLYDAGGLEGLWRIASFLALGLSLLAVSWFYGRFVFGLGADGRQLKSGQL